MSEYDNITYSNIFEGYETLSNLDAQPYLAFVDLTFGGHHFPSVPPKYIQNLTLQDLGTDGVTISLVLLDELGDEIEELLYRSVSEDNFLRFGHVTGRQSKRYKFNLFSYTLGLEPVGTILTITGQGQSVFDNTQSNNVLSAGTSPHEAVISICNKLGYQYTIGDDNSYTINRTNPIILSDGNVKEFNLINDNLIDYIHKEISPYATRYSDGVSGFQFYVDEETTPPTAHFHPIEISGDHVRTYIYQKGLNTNVISFQVTTDFVITQNGENVSTASILEANVLDPITKTEDVVVADINDVNKNVNGEYSTISSEQNKQIVNASGMNYGETVSMLKYRMTTAQTTLEADLTIVGDPTIKIGTEIRIIVLTAKNNLHHTSGRYNVLGVSHSISSGIMITTLNVVKTGNEDGIELKSYKALYK